MMRKLIYLLLLSVAVSCGDSSSSESVGVATPNAGAGTTVVQTAIPPDTSHVLENIEDIKREYGFIISGAESISMDSSFFNYDCNGEKAGRVVYFSDEQGLRLIRHTYSEYSHFSATDEYFLKGDSLFFVLYTDVSWHFVGEGETRDDVTEKRFYIINGKALKCLEKRFIVKSPSSANTHSATNRETDCAALPTVLDKFKQLTKYRSREKYPDCLDN